MAHEVGICPKLSLLLIKRTQKRASRVLNTISPCGVDRPGHRSRKDRIARRKRPRRCLARSGAYRCVVCEVDVVCMWRGDRLGRRGRSGGWFCYRFLELLGPLCLLLDELESAREVVLAQPLCVACGCQVGCAGCVGEWVCHGCGGG
jgi:hypothetical protein